MPGYRPMANILLFALLGGVLVGHLLSGYRHEKSVPKETEMKEPLDGVPEKHGMERVHSEPTADESTQTNPVAGTAGTTPEVPTPHGCFFTNLTETEALLTCTGDNVTENLPTASDAIIWITISNTDVTIISKDMFAQYPNLELIDFTDNQLRSISGRAFTSLPNLTSLYLWRNSLSDNSFESEPFDGLSSLTTLYLNQNKLTQLPIKLFGVATSLMYLNIANNDIARLGPEYCSVLGKLQFLDLGYNRISSLNFTENCMPYLEIFNVEGNEILVIQIGALMKLGNLKTFTGSHMKTNLTIEEGAFNGNLTKLDLSHNPNIDISTTDLASLESLEELSLDGCCLTHLNGTSFMSKPNLTKLAIHNNPFVCDCQVAWMVEAIAEDKSWALDWGPGNSTYFRPRCGSPDWLLVKDITELYPDDLTCEPPHIKAESDTNQTNTWNTTYIVFEALLTKGIPYSTWLFPDGRNVTGRNHSDKANVTNGYPYNAWLHPVEMTLDNNMDSSWGSTATEIMSANHSMTAKLIIDRDFDMIGPVKFTLIASNVAGDSNLTFWVYTPLPEICLPYCNCSYT